MSDDISRVRDVELGSLGPISNEAVDILAQLDLDEEFILGVFDGFSRAMKAIEQWPAVYTVSFPATQPRDCDPPSREFIENHWREISGRCKVATISANETLHGLLRGFVDGLNSLNVLSLALTARAALEHAASFDDLATKMAKRKEGIGAIVIPYLQKQEDQEDLGGLYDPALVEELTRFQHGVRLWMGGEIPEDKKGWKNWIEHYVDYDKDREKGKEKSPLADVVSEIVKSLKLSQRNALTLIEKLAKNSGMWHAHGAYSMLCEYCHPNADNRSLAIVSNQVVDNQVRIEIVRGKNLGPTQKKGMELALVVMGSAVETHISAHNKMLESHLLKLDLVIEGIIKS